MFSKRNGVNPGLAIAFLSGLFDRFTGGVRGTAPQLEPRKPAMAAVHVMGFQKAPWVVGNNTRLPEEHQRKLIQAARAKRARKNAKRAADHFWICDNNPVCRAY